MAGMEDGGDYPVAAARRMLAQHQKSWADLQLTEGQFLRATRDRVVVGGVIAHMSDGSEPSVIHFKRLPSRSRNIEERDWTVDIRKFDWLSWDIDPTQDLLLVVARPEVSVFHYP